MKKKPSSTPRIHRYPMTEVRIHLGAIIKQVHLEKAYVILEKDGIPMAALMDIEEFEDYLELQDPNVNRSIEESHKEYLAGKSRPATDFFKTLDEEESEAKKRGVRRKSA